MPEIEPVTIDAIKDVVEDRGPQAQWDPDSMETALIEVAKGKNQEDAAEGRGFDQPRLSKYWNKVKERREELRKNMGESNIFRDPLEEAKEDFKEFFEDLNSEYEFGIRDLAIKMMVDEVDDSRRLPHPLAVENHLKGTKSGVSGQDVDYIVRRYRNWLENYEPTASQVMGADSQRGGPQYGGPEMGQSQGQQQQQTPGGVPIGNPNSEVQGGYGGGSPQQTQPGRGQQQYGQPTGQQAGTDPKVQQLTREVEELKDIVRSQAEDDSSSEKIKVEADNGRMMEMTVDQAERLGVLGDDDDGNDLIETIQMLKEVGVIGDDGGNEMAEQVGQAIQQMGEKQMQAQQQISQNFQTVLQQMQEMQEEDDDDLSIDDVESVIEDKLEEDEVDRLERQLDEMRSEFASQLRDVKKSSSEGIEDPEYLKTDRQMQFRERQLDAMNENLQELPTKTAAMIQKGVVPLVERLQEGDGSSPLWNPPAPAEASEPQPRAGSPNAPARESAGRQEVPQQSAATQSPSRGGAQSRRSQQQQQTQQQTQQSEDTMQENTDTQQQSEYAQDVYDKLGIGSSGSSGGDA